MIWAVDCSDGGADGVLLATGVGASAGCGSLAIGVGGVVAGVFGVVTAGCPVVAGVGVGVGVAGAGGATSGVAVAA